MFKKILAIFYVSSLYGLTGLELAQKMEARPKPNDLKSENTMVLINKKGKKKTTFNQIIAGLYIPTTFCSTAFI